MTTAVVTNPIGVGTWAIEPVHSSIDFSVRPLMVSKVHSRFETVSGTTTIAPDGTAAVTAEIDVTSPLKGLLRQPGAPVTIRTQLKRRQP